MKKMISFLAILLMLTSCSIFRVHKMDIEQGNVISDDAVSQLHRGMSENQVKDIMGTPMLTNTFTPNRISYTYTFKPGYGELNEKMLILTFRNGRLQTIQQTRYNVYAK